MIVALLITWAFWGALIGLLAYWKRSWVPVLVFPLLLTGLICVISIFSSSVATWFAVGSHALFILILGIGRLKDKGPNEWKRPD